MSSSCSYSPAAASVLGLSSLFQFADSGIVSRTLLAAPDLRVVLFGIAPGQELTEHTSTRRAMVQVLQGECLFKFNGLWRTLKAGEMLHMPPGHPHAVRVEGNPCAFLLTLGAPGSGLSAGTDASAEANA